MVYYPLPKFIRKSQLRDARPYRWSAADKREDIEALIATCSRCVQAIASQKKKCRKPASQRCDHCADGNRGGCDLVPLSLCAKVNRLYDLRRLYDQAVLASGGPQAARVDAEVARTGVKLARAQRAFNLEFSHLRRVAAHSGTPIGVPTQVPTTTPQMLGLLLAEHRSNNAMLERNAKATEALAEAISSLANSAAVIADRFTAAAAADEDEDDDDDDDEETSAVEFEESDDDEMDDA